MHLGAFRFSPDLLPSVAVILLLTLFISLGMWQLGRAEEKRDLIERFEARREATALGAGSLSALPIDELRYRKVRLVGHYLADRQFLLDNRVRERQAGFEVLT
ncbi:MAG TPA: SURF1 family protein, partial [Thioalkalivibrio sp.]|nr:SURF1 family protein [Thioalkalivibrio sp.]